MTTNFNSKSNSLRITFLCPYPFDTVGGQRFRFEQYYSQLKVHGYLVNVCPFLSYSTYNILYKQGYFFKKSIGIGYGFLKRLFHLFYVQKSDYVFIFREASPIGWPIYEWIIAKVLRKKIIYDFDDAIWLSNTSSENSVVSLMKFHQKVGMICKWASKVSVGNNYLAEFATKYNQEVIVNPTTIDTTAYHNQPKDQNTKLIVIGWTGTHSTLKYLDLIYPVLKKLEMEYEFVFEVIADKPIHYDLTNFSFKKWNKENEIHDLLNFNIGIMPLTDDEWSKGKCGFKALQYMSLGIPAVVSPVGVNCEIITHGVEGYCCSTEDDWYKYLSGLINDVNLRIKMGEAAVSKVKKYYSVVSNTENFLALFL